MEYHEAEWKGKVYGFYTMIQNSLEEICVPYPEFFQRANVAGIYIIMPDGRKYYATPDEWYLKGELETKGEEQIIWRQCLALNKMTLRQKAL